MHSFGELSLNVEKLFKLLRTKLKTLGKLYDLGPKQKGPLATYTSYMLQLPNISCINLAKQQVQWKLNTSMVI